MTRWWLLLLVGCGRIGFDPSGAFGDDATGDAQTIGDGRGTDGGSSGGSSVTNVGGNSTDVAGTATMVSVVIGAVQPGDAILVSTGWHDATANVGSVTDSIGTSYVVSQAVIRASTVSQILHSGFATTSAASVTVTVMFTGTAQGPSERVAIYRGVSNSGAIQGANGSNSNSATLLLAGFSAGPNWVFVTSDTANAPVTSHDPSWTTRLTTSAGDVMMDATFATSGFHSGMASLASSSPWVTETFQLPPK